jgi:biotin carboxyl carrier protein
MRHRFTIGDANIDAAVVRRNGCFVLICGETEYPIALRRLDGAAAEISVGDRVWRAQIAVDGHRTFVKLDGDCHAVEWSNPLDRLAHGGGGSLDDIVQAPMPGTVIAVHAKPGDQVTRGQTLMVIESMKLETAIAAWRDGTVKTVHLAQGQTFDRAASLITLEAENKE